MPALSAGHFGATAPPVIPRPTPIVILSEAKNLFSRPPLIPRPTPIVILSEAKNLFSRLISTGPEDSSSPRSSE